MQLNVTFIREYLPATNLDTTPERWGEGPYSLRRCWVPVAYANADMPPFSVYLDYSSMKESTVPRGYSTLSLPSRKFLAFFRGYTYNKLLRFPVRFRIKLQHRCFP